MAIRLFAFDYLSLQSTPLASSLPNMDGRFEIVVPAGIALRPSQRLYVAFEGARLRPVVRPVKAEVQDLGLTTVSRISKASLVRSERPSFSGTVVDAMGIPVASARLEAFLVDLQRFSVRPFAGISSAETKNPAPPMTDAAGRFTLTTEGPVPVPLEDGAGVVLLASAPGHAPGMVPLDPGRETLLITLGSRTTEVRGQVVSPGGQPVADAETVVVSRRTEDSVFATSRSDAQGFFAVQVPESTEGYILSVNHPDWVPWEQVLPGGSATKPARVELSQGTAVRGRVLEHGSETPLRSAQVRVLASVEGFPWTHETETDSEGRFEVRGIGARPGGNPAVFEKRGFLPVTIPVEIGAAGHGLDLSPVLLARAYRLRFTVLSPDEQPVEGAYLSLVGPSADPGAKKGSTGAEGSIAFEVARGEYEIEVVTAGFPLANKRFTVSGDTQENLHLGYPGSVAGTVVWSDYSPAGKVGVRCLPVLPDPESEGGLYVLKDQRLVMTDGDGRFTFENLAAGLYLVEPVAEDVVGHVAPDVGLSLSLYALPEGGSLEDVQLLLRKPTQLAIGLSEPPDLKELTLHLTQLDQDGRDFTEFPPVSLGVENGTAVLEKVVPATYRVHADLGEHFVATESVVEVKPDVTNRLVLKVLPSASLRGLVVSAEGNPVPDAEISLWMPNTSADAYVPDVNNRSLKRGSSDAAGGFSLGGLAAGTYSLLVRKTGLTPSFASVEFARSEAQWRQIVLDPGFSVEVALRASDGGELGEYIATLIRAVGGGPGTEFQGIQHECEPVASGCRFDNVVPGSYKLAITLLGEPGSGSPMISETIPLAIPSPAPLAVTLRVR